MIKLNLISLLMRYKKALQLTNSDFKRLYGVSKETYKIMIQEVAKERLGKRGSPSKLLIADQILLTLQYLREYRTFFHLATDWGVHESTAWRIVKRIEDILVNSEKFRLPSQRQWQQAQTEIEVNGTPPLNGGACVHCPPQSLLLMWRKQKLNVLKKTETRLQWKTTLSHPQDANNY
jgi:hypothetical protein